MGKFEYQAYFLTFSTDWTCDFRDEMSTFYLVKTK